MKSREKKKKGWNLEKKKVIIRKRTKFERLKN